MTFLTRSKTALLIILCLILGSSVMAITEKTATITLNNGTIFENVVFKNIKDFHYLKVNINDEEKRISYTDIKSIIDPEGRDITARELNRAELQTTVVDPPPKSNQPSESWLTEQEKKDPPKETWKSTNDEVFREARKKRWETAIGFHGNYSIPFGSYYEGIDPGIGFGGDFSIAFSSKLSGKFIVSKSGMKVSDEIGFYSIDPMVTILSEDISIRTIRFILAAQYNHHVINNNVFKGTWYFYTGLGITSEKGTIKAMVRDDYSSVTYNIDESFSDSYFTMSSGGGYQHMISKKIAVDFGAQFDLLYIAANNGIVQYAYIFDLKIGLTAFLGGEK